MEFDATMAAKVNESSYNSEIEGLVLEKAELLSPPGDNIANNRRGSIVEDDGYWRKNFYYYHHHHDYDHGGGAAGEKAFAAGSSGGWYQRHHHQQSSLNMESSFVLTRQIYCFFFLVGFVVFMAEMSLLQRGESRNFEEDGENDERQESDKVEEDRDRDRRKDHLLKCLVTKRIYSRCPIGQCYCFYATPAEKAGFERVVLHDGKVVVRDEDKDGMEEKNKMFRHDKKTNAAYDDCENLDCSGNAHQEFSNNVYGNDEVCSGNKGSCLCCVENEKKLGQVEEEEDLSPSLSAEDGDTGEYDHKDEKSFDRLALALSYAPCCTICLCRYLPGEYVSFSSDPVRCCSHLFHHECLMEWLLAGVNDPRCPCCRARYIPQSSFLHQDDNGEDGGVFPSGLSF